MLTCELVELESPKVLLLSPSVSRDAHMVIWHNDTMMSLFFELVLLWNNN